jgi:hypothetical protein
VSRLSSVDALAGSRSNVGRKGEGESVPEEWRVVTGRDDDKEIRPGDGMIGSCWWWW